MNTTEKPIAPAQPKLVKMSATYKLVVPQDVEAKIRYLIRKFPHNEWSGILFITHEGNFKDNNLVITCKDIYPMAAGSSGWTEFKMSEGVASYMARNMELFNCDLGLVHSHHTLGAFFSSQDLQTLRDQGNDKNCFVSLIVDTRGQYVAAITRKVCSKKEVEVTVKDSSYEFFGEGSVTMPVQSKPKLAQVESTVIEYFMLDVERHTVEEPFAYLDERFDELQAKDNAISSGFPSMVANNSYPIQPKQQDLFDNESNFIVNRERWDGKDLCIALPVQVDKKAVHEAVARILCCSLTINPDKVDLKQWVTKNMVKAYSKIFGETDIANGYTSYKFDLYADSIINWTIKNFDNTQCINLKEYGNDKCAAAIASAIKEELTSYGSNLYIDEYCDYLDYHINKI